MLASEAVRDLRIYTNDCTCAYYINDARFPNGIELKEKTMLYTTLTPPSAPKVQAAGPVKSGGKGIFPATETGAV